MKIQLINENKEIKQRSSHNAEPKTDRSDRSNKQNHGS